MLNREFIFSNPDVIKFLNQNFVMVAGDNWYRRRAKDDASVWFRNVAKQAGRGKNGSTQQGSYFVTPKGDLLRFINTSDHQKFIVQMLEAKKIWNGVVQEKETEIPAMKNHDYRINVRPIDPQKDILIEVQSRALVEKDGKINRWDSQGKVGGKPALGHLWIKQQEWLNFVKQLQPLKDGQQISFPDRLIHRIARFHLVDNTRGEGPAWKRKDLQQTKLTLTKNKTGYDIKGTFQLNNKAEQRSYIGNIVGKLVLDQSATRPISWTMTAYGNHAGEGKFTRNARPGARPLGFTFEYLAKPKPIDLVPPQHMRWQRGYWEAEKH